MIDTASLPSKWYLREQDNERYIYGIDCDSSNQSYNIFCTNFTSTWAERLTKGEIISKADDSGIRIDDEGLTLLIETFFLSKGDLNEYIEFRWTPDASVKRESDEEEHGTSKLNGLEIKFKKRGYFDWTFELTKLSDSNHIKFMEALNYQQFVNHDFLLHKIKEFEKMIESKDQFIYYLSENYISLNGDEMIKKYKKNNQANADSLDKYDKQKWDLKVYESFKHAFAGKKSENDKFVDSIILSIDDEYSWNTNSLFKSTAYSPKDPMLKKENSDGELPKSALHGNRGNNFLKSESLGYLNESLNEPSPSKRTKKRIGLLPRKKRKS